jgi:hypothetical protein
MVNPEYRASVLRFFLLFLPFHMAQWFTPLLIVWRRHPLGKALFFNFVAIGRNWSGILLLFLFSNALVAGVFHLIMYFASGMALFFLRVYCLALLAFWVCLLITLYRDFFPAGEKPAHISEHA